jgi:hypothetical protein
VIRRPRRQRWHRPAEHGFGVILKLVKARSDGQQVSVPGNTPYQPVQKLWLYELYQEASRWDQSEAGSLQRKVKRLGRVPP